MKITKIVKIGGAYAKKLPYEYEGVKYDADIKKGDEVTIKSEGQIVAGQYGDQMVFLIETRNGDKNLTLNQTTLNILHDELGDDSKNWVGKKVKVLIKKDTVAGKKVDIAYLVTDGWVLDEYGDLVKPSNGELQVDSETGEEIPF